MCSVQQPNKVTAQNTAQKYRNVLELWYVKNSGRAATINTPRLFLTCGVIKKRANAPNGLVHRWERWWRMSVSQSIGVSEWLTVGVTVCVYVWMWLNVYKKPPWSDESYWCLWYEKDVWLCCRANITRFFFIRKLVEFLVLDFLNFLANSSTKALLRLSYKKSM